MKLRMVTWITGLILTPFTVLATPQELARAKSSLVLAHELLSAPNCDHASEKKIFTDLEQAIVGVSLSDGEVIDLVSFATSSAQGQTIVNRFALHAIYEERLAAEQSTFEAFNFYDSNSKLKEVVSQEALLIPDVKQKKILFVGGGPLPYSALFAHTLTGAKVAVCDCNKDTLAHSERFIRGMGLAHRFQFIEGVAHNLNASDYDVVWLAAMIKQKEEAIKSLTKTLRPNSFVLVRQFEDRGQILFGPTLSPSTFHEYSMYAQTEYQLSSWCVRAILLQRREPTARLPN